MPAPTYNFQIEQGSFFEIDFQYNDEDGNPVDLSSSCVLLQCIYPDGSKQPLVFNSEEPDQSNKGYSLTKNNLGQINFQLFSSLTSNYTFDSIVYDLDVVTEDENTRILTGTIGLITRNTTIPTCSLVGQAEESPSETPQETQTPSETPTSSSVPEPSPTPLEFEDLCLPSECSNIDVFSTVYSGDSFAIEDYQNNSGTILIQNTGVIENFEVAINGLRHDNPQDLLFVLTPPNTIGNGSGILLSANSKVPSHASGYPFSFMFSNRANAGAYLHNINNGDLCNIFDKTDLVRFEGNELLSDFDHIMNNSVSGLWTLNIQDTDVGVSGSIDSWKIVVTYPGPDEEY